MEAQNTAALIAPGTSISTSAASAQAILANTPERSIQDAFTKSLSDISGDSSNRSTKQSETVKTSINNLSQELSDQLQSQDSSDDSFSLENSTLDELFFEDSNNDGIINEGDNIVISFTDDTGESNETRIPVTEEFATLIQGINSSDIQGVNSMFMDQFLTLFIEQMKVEILHQNSQMRDMISEGAPDFSL